MSEKKEEMTVAQAKNNEMFFSRFDRSVMDNLAAIPKSFGKYDSGIVQDFIVFIYHKLKQDLFGFSTFTLNDFAKATGRNKADLCVLHPDFNHSNKRGPEPPTYFGHEFKSTFDYALFNMLQKSIIFDRTYEDKFQGKVVELKNFPILQDVRITIDKKSNNVKLYQIRVSEQLLQGFIRRYYLYDTNGYKSIKGKFVNGRKRFYLMLYRTRHLLLTQGKTKTKMALDQIADIIGYEVTENKNRKTSVKRALDALKKTIPFDYEFVRGNPAKKWQESYHVEFDFSQMTEGESRSLHTFYSGLIRELKEFFDHKYGNTHINDEKEPYQRWLNNKDADADDKVQFICRAYYRAFNVELPRYDAAVFLESGITDINENQFR